MTILITGVGAVGAHVAAKLQDMGEAIVVYDLRPHREFLRSIFDLERATVVVGDVNDLALLTKTIADHKIDRIVHLAAFMTRELRSQPLAGVRLNIMGTGTVLEAARQTGVKRIVFTSTRGVNQIAPAPEAGTALDEDFTMNVLSNRPKTMYELSKLTGEYLGLLYNDTFGVEFVALRLGGGFGPTPAMPKSLTAGVLWQLVRNAAVGRPVTIDDPSYTYAGRHEFIYFKDDAEAIALALFRPDLQKRVYNIRMTETYDYQAVVDMVRRVFPDVPIDIKAVSNTSMSPGHAPRGDFADTTAARRELGWEPKYDFETGLREWGEWLRKNERLYDGVA